MNEVFESRFSRLMRDRNFLGAGMLLKNLPEKGDEHAEYVGELAGAVVEQLSRLDRRQDREQILYLRSILGWLLRDVPGLSPLYREQLSAAEGVSTGPMADLYRNMRNIADVAAGRKSFSEGAEETADSIKRGFDDARVRNEGFDQFLKAAEEGVKGGVEQFNDILKRFTEPAGEPTMRQADPASEAGEDQGDQPPKNEPKAKPVDIETEE